VAHYFSFFVLGKAANIEIFKDFTRAKKWKRTSQYEYLFLNNPLGSKSPICNTSLSGCQNISEGFALLSSEI